MSKQLLFNEEARNALKRGVDKVGDAVRVTLGAKGRNVVIDTGFGNPTVTNDGVTIAKAIVLKDKFENMGADIVKGVANRSNDLAGDGTTTSVLLTQALVREGFKRMMMGANPMGIRRGMEQASKDAVEELVKMARQINTDKEIRQVATISAESKVIGDIVVDAIKDVGKDGVITVEESTAIQDIESEVVNGIQFDRGYVSPHFITNSARMEATYKNVAILITDKKLSNIEEILPFLQKIKSEKNLVVIADEIEGDVLNTFIFNKLQRTFNVLAVRAYGYGDSKRDAINDLALLTGATVVSESTGVTFENAEANVLGRAERVISTKDNTTVIGGHGNKKEIKARIEGLKIQKTNVQSKFEKDKIETMIGKLSGGFAVIKVGAPTETEMTYLKLKIEDAVHATKSAISEGIVAGGGTALAKISEKLQARYKQSPEAKDAHENAQSFEFSVGYLAVVEALKEPLLQIARNAGKQEIEVLTKILAGKENAGYDALTDTYVTDMFKVGIVDPVKVTRCALQHSTSAVGVLLTTEVAITDEPEEKKL